MTAHPFFAHETVQIVAALSGWQALSIACVPLLVEWSEGIFRIVSSYP
jgi:hypothetical protein